MNETTAQMRLAAADLTAIGVRFAVVGGLGVSLRTEPRFTRDVDLAVAVSDDADAERVAALMIQRGYRVVAQVEHEAAGRLSTVRLVPPRARVDPDTGLEIGPESGVGAVVDLLFASCGIEPEIVAGAELLEALPGWTVPVARAEHLIVMKLLSRDDHRRPQDLIDLRTLLNAIDPGAHDRIRASIRIVSERGFARGRDLAADFARLLTAEPPEAVG